MKRIALLLIIGFLSVQVIAQTDRMQPPIVVKEITTPIQIDGVLDDPAWQLDNAAADFWLYFPTDSMHAQKDTEIRMVFDDKNLYVAAKCYAAGDQYVIPTLRRDYRAGGSDNITLLFDPFNDRTNAFVFGMNPLGVRREALISNGGQQFRDFSESWDNKWYGEAAIHDGYWVAEFAIPFKTLRYNEDVKNWKFNSYRFDIQSNETSTWMHIPRNQIIMNLAFMGDMQWEEAPPKPGTNISVIPYAIGSAIKDFEEDTDLATNFNFGADAKIAVTTGLNLDLTVNPDFSQVEVDQQVTNLTRFEVFLPERRQFFQENADLFSSFGAPSGINPFFSRRIGISIDTATEQNIQNRIYYGARLSGNLNNNWRVGLLNMQAADDPDNGLPSYNYTVAALRRKLFTRSNISAIFVNKQTFEEIDENSDFNEYNRVLGLDYNLASSDNTWTGKAFYHQGITPDESDEQYAYGTGVFYTKRTHGFDFVHDFVGKNYNAEVGFVPRQGFRRVLASGNLIFYPEQLPKMIQHSPSVEVRSIFQPEEGMTDRKIQLAWNASFNDFSRLNIRVANDLTQLLEEFNPTRIDTAENKVLLLQPGEYTYTSIGASYSSDRRKPFSFRVEPILGQFFNGKRYGVSGGFNLNLQPRASIALNYNYNYIDLPEGYHSTSIFLIGPRIDLTFNRNMFLTTFVQYNSQLENVNINARFQWRFKPVSDFFLVYTDNYYSTDFNTRNRSIVAKLTYWLNL